MLTINPWSSTRLYIIFYSIRHRKHKKFFARPLAKPHHGFNNRHAFCREFRVAVDYRLSPAESISSSDILNGISTSCYAKKNNYLPQRSRTTWEIFVESAVRFSLNFSTFERSFLYDSTKKDIGMGRYKEKVYRECNSIYYEIKMIALSFCFHFRSSRVKGKKFFKFDFFHFSHP